jgi:ligand-binding SRPBCC domain-containing protein
MGFYQFEREQKVNASIDEVWDFISDPRNLKKITPKYMGFDIISQNLTPKMYPGMIIHYKVSPVLNIPTDWVTEITHVVDQKFFVDEQRLGPYKMWHHQHTIEPIANGTLMKDIVSYVPPFGLLGDSVNSIMIKRKLNEIFDYRWNAIVQEYGEYNGSF